MAFNLLYHPTVAEEDLPLIPRNIQHRIARAIEIRLTKDPEQHGSPLRKTLKGYWKLRVGDYRIVYKLAGNDIIVLGIRHRQQIYEEVLRRLKRS